MERANEERIELSDEDLKNVAAGFFFSIGMWGVIVSIDTGSSSSGNVGMRRHVGPK
jgi:hypothetical protein